MTDVLLKNIHWSSGSARATPDFITLSLNGKSSIFHMPKIIYNPPKGDDLIIPLVNDPAYLALNKSLTLKELGNRTFPNSSNKFPYHK